MYIYIISYRKNTSERDVIYQLERDDSGLICLLGIQHSKNTMLTSAISDEPSSGFPAVEDLMTSHKTTKNTEELKHNSKYHHTNVMTIYIAFLS